MEALVAILLVIAIILGVLFFLPGSCNGCSCNDATGNVGDDNGNGGGNGGGGANDGTGDTDVNITTGKVDIDIVNLDNESVVGKKLMFEGEKEGKTILFQPGDVYHTEGFKIKNQGNVEVVYKMFITAKENVDMVKFTDAFKFYITTDPNDLTGAIEMLEFNGTLGVAKTSATFYVVVSMDIDAGNEYQDLTFNGIGITVNASQVMEGN